MEEFADEIFAVPADVCPGVYLGNAMFEVFVDAAEAVGGGCFLGFGRVLWRWEGCLGLGCVAVNSVVMGRMAVVVRRLRDVIQRGAAEHDGCDESDGVKIDCAGVGAFASAACVDFTAWCISGKQDLSPGFDSLTVRSNLRCLRATSPSSTAAAWPEHPSLNQAA